MELEIENLKALVHGRELTPHQRGLALSEWVQVLEILNKETPTKHLPEYNEILYHARTLTEEQFREYWHEITT